MRQKFGQRRDVNDMRFSERSATFKTSFVSEIDFVIDFVIVSEIGFVIDFPEIDFVIDRFRRSIM